MGSRHVLPFGNTLSASVLGLFFAAAFASAAPANPFEALNGKWTGTGMLTPIDGKPDKVSCRAAYESRDDIVNQNIECAGAAHKFSANVNMTYHDGKVAGSWTETLHAASGDVSGTANGGSIRARLGGEKFAGRLSIDVNGAEHRITVVQLDKGSGTYRPVASVSLHR